MVCRGVGSKITDGITSSRGLRKEQISSTRLQSPNSEALYAELNLPFRKILSVPRKSFVYASPAELRQEVDMKHAGDEALNSVEPLLKRIRKYDALSEKGRGKFYRGSSAFLHFHEDPAGLFADLKVGSEWKRLPINSPKEQEKLLAALAKNV